jgi:hypothetical protein
MRLANHSTAQGTHPFLGTYTETRFFWTANDSTPVETAFKVFADGDTCLFEQHFPRGLTDCARADPHGMSQPLLAFPSFATGDGVGGGGRDSSDDVGDQDSPLTAITWRGAFSQLAGGAVPLNQLSTNQLGRSNGGPVVLFNESSGR